MVTLRDIGHQAIPHVTEELVEAFNTLVGQRTPSQLALLKLSDELVDELQAANLYVFSMRMYNFSIPAVFKAYIDQIVRIGLTVTATWKGQLKDKKAVFVIARGGGQNGPGEVREVFNFVDPYLRTVMSALGVTDQTFIHLTNMSNGNESVNSLAEARARIKELTGG